MDKVSVDSLFLVLKDVLIRFNLDLKDCRGQGYDGASNMAGRFRGLQALVAAEETRAIYVHCFAHSLNLVVQHSIQQDRKLRDIFSLIGSILNFIRDSPKRKAWLETFLKEGKELGSGFANIQPLCPTRWSVRGGALAGICSHYKAILAWLKEVDQTDSSARGLTFRGVLVNLRLRCWC